MGGLAGYAEAFGELANGVVAQLIIFEESLSLFAHGNTFPGHGHSLLSRKCYPCPQTMCYLCLGPVQRVLLGFRCHLTFELGFRFEHFK